MSTTAFLGRFRGTVVDNQDPSRVGRVKVAVPEVLGTVTSGWALPALPVTGAGSGFFAVPSVGAAVWVEFESGDPSRPVWTGGWFATGGVPQQAGPGQLVVKTPGGRTITLDDDGAEVQVADPGGAKIVLDASGIELSSSGFKVAITAAGVSINDGALEVT